MRVFRYFDTKGGVATLAEQRMRWASPRAFNDPFEFTPNVQPASDSLIEEKLRSDFWVHDFYEKKGKARGLNEAESRAAYFADEFHRRLEQVKSSREQRADQQRLQFLDDAAKHFRILCFSHTYDSILMWSHYAEKHRGIVLEIETDELEPDEDLRSELFEVRYRSSPPLVQSLSSSDDEFEQNFDRAFSTKALHWSYEEEVRIKRTVPEGMDLDEPVYRKLPLGCIKRVIVGCYTHFVKGVMEEVERMANLSDYSHIKFQRAVIHDREFKLRFVNRP